MQRKVLVTGGAGFIGSALCRRLVGDGVSVLNIDALTYAGNLQSLAAIGNAPNYRFAKIDICDRRALTEAFETFAPDQVIHLAAESHVDRSITAGDAFIQTNIVGTFSLLETARAYWRGLPEPRRDGFRFLHVSTDEVYGSLGEDGAFVRRDGLRSEFALFSVEGRRRSSRVGLGAHLRLPGADLELLEQLRPLSLPREADSADHPQRARWQAAAGLRRRRQCARLALCRGPRAGARPDRRRGRIGETYNVGGRNERRNLEVVMRICAILDRLRPLRAARIACIAFVADRPGHDRRYAIDATKLERELGWRALETFETGSRRRCAGISTTNGGGARCATRSTPASASASSPRPGPSGSLHPTATGHMSYPRCGWPDLRLRR